MAFAPDTAPPGFERFDGPARLLAAWLHWRGDGRPMPSRHDIDPLDIPHLLATVFLLDLEGEDFRFRLVGEDVNERYGHRLTGRRLTELMSGPALEETLEEHRQCVRDQVAVLVDNTGFSAGLYDVQRYVRLILPIADAEDRVAFIIGVMQFVR